MKTNTIRFFLAGDIFGSVGMHAVQTLLPAFIKEEKIDITVINGENATGGVGLSLEDARSILAAGADVITGGNHTFEKRDYWEVLEILPEVLRPANYPEGTVGRGYGIFEKNGLTFAVLNLQGREDMYPLDCPFRCADAVLSSLEKEGFNGPIIVDFHAESNQEKEALGLYLDGRVLSVTGTHTHVQTADERILSGGTVYQTDLGMTGTSGSVIGVDPALAIKRNITQVLYKMEPHNGPGFLRGLIVDLDLSTGKAFTIKRIQKGE